MRRLAVAALIAVAALATACGDAERDAPKRPSAVPGAPSADPYPGDRSLDPAEAARAYVEAIDRRDGKRFCSVVAPYISGRWDMFLNDPAHRSPPGVNCPKVIPERIGYMEDCCPDEFLHARVREAAAPRQEHGLTRVDLVIDLDVKENSGAVTQDRRVKPLRDTIWLTRIGGAWRVAKLSAVAQAASLHVPRDTGNGPEDPLTPPDVRAELRSYAADLERLRKLLAEEEASYEDVGRPADCDGGVELTDPGGDPRDFQSPSTGTPPPKAGRVDMRSFQISSRDERICAEWEAAGDVDGDLMLTLSINGVPPGGAPPAGQPGTVPPAGAPPAGAPPAGAPPAGSPPPTRLFLQKFAVWLRPDGKGRVTSGEDDQDRPVPVPAELGVDGNRVVLVIDSESFERGSPSPISAGSPPFDAFLFETEAIARVSPRRMLKDAVGSPASTRFDYPSGRAVRYP